MNNIEKIISDSKTFEGDTENLSEKKKDVFDTSDTSMSDKNNNIPNFDIENTRKYDINDKDTIIKQKKLTQIGEKSISTDKEHVSNLQCLNDNRDCFTDIQKHNFSISETFKDEKKIFKNIKQEPEDNLSKTENSKFENSSKKNSSNFFNTDYNNSKKENFSSIVDGQSPNHYNFKQKTEINSDPSDEYLDTKKKNNSISFDEIFVSTNLNNPDQGHSRSLDNLKYNKLNDNINIDNKKSHDQNSSTINDVNEKDTKIKQSQFHTIIIPYYSRWFKIDKVHNIEKESLPEFFNNSPSKSSRIYVDYRNFMIKSYRMNPNEFLTLTSCRRNLVGDVGTIMRVHRFLNKWGLINYQVDPHLKPNYAIKNFLNGKAKKIEQPDFTELLIKYDIPRGTFPFNNFNLSSDNYNLKKIKELLNLPKSNDSVSSNTNNFDLKNFNSSISPKKNSSVDNLDQLNTKKRLISQLYNENMTKTFNDEWTKEEESMLLTAIKIHKNNWYQISESLNFNKTPQQCIMKFLMLPIEKDLELNDLDINDDNDSVIKLLKYSSNWPISSVDNPILNTLVLMTQLIDSDVAKAASSRACKVMDEKIKDKILEINSNKNHTLKDNINKSFNVLKHVQNNNNLKEKGNNHCGQNKILSTDCDKYNLNNVSNSDVKIENNSIDFKNQKFGFSSQDINQSHNENISKINNNNFKKNHESNDNEILNSGDKNEDAISESENDFNVDFTDTFSNQHKINNENDLKSIFTDASITSLGILGARSHLFATYEEREMNNLAFQIVNHQLLKVDLTLKKIENLEKFYDHEKRNLIKQQKKIFVDRLFLINSTITLKKKLNNAISLILDLISEGNDESLNNKLNDIKSLIFDANSCLFTEKREIITKDTKVNKCEKEDEQFSNNKNTQSDFVPISIKSPQSFRVWIP